MNRYESELRDSHLYNTNEISRWIDCELNFPRKIHLYQFEQQKQEVANWLHSIQVARWIWQLTLKWWLRHSPKAKVFGLLFWEIFEPTLKQNIRLGQQHQWQYSTPSFQQRPNWKTFELMVLTRSPTKTKNCIKYFLDIFECASLYKITNLEKHDRKTGHHDDHKCIR